MRLILLNRTFAVYKHSALGEITFCSSNYDCISFFQFLAKLATSVFKYLGGYLEMFEIFNVMTFRKI